MIALIGAEIYRMASRRLVRVLCLLTLCAIALSGVIVFFRSSPTSPDRFELGDLPGILMGSSVPLIIAGLVFGASFAGAEWEKGTMTTALTWEPRRVRLFVAKAAATVVSVVVIFAVLQSLLGLALAPAGIWRGSTQGVGAEWLAEVTGAILRGGLVAAVGAVIAFALAMASHNTEAALTVAFTYVGAAEEFLRAWKPLWSGWLFKDNAARFILAEGVGFPMDRTTAEAGVVLVGYAVLLAVVSLVVFRRRDVT